MSDTAEDEAAVRQLMRLAIRRLEMDQVVAIEAMKEAKAALENAAHLVPEHVKPSPFRAGKLSNPGLTDWLTVRQRALVALDRALQIAEGR